MTTTKVSTHMVSVGRHAATLLYASEWWVGLSDYQIVMTQGFIRELCMPIRVFQDALYAATGATISQIQWAGEAGMVRLLLSKGNPIPIASHTKHLHSR